MPVLLGLAIARSSAIVRSIGFKLNGRQSADEGPWCAAKKIWLAAAGRAHLDGEDDDARQEVGGKGAGRRPAQSPRQRRVPARQLPPQQRAKRACKSNGFEELRELAMSLRLQAAVADRPAE